MSVTTTRSEPVDAATAPAGFARLLTLRLGEAYAVLPRLPITGRSLEVHRDPDASSGRYRTLATLAPGDVFASAAVAALSFPVADLFV
jgi:hypothetical protein